MFAPALVRRPALQFLLRDLFLLETDERKVRALSSERRAVARGNNLAKLSGADRLSTPPEDLVRTRAGLSVSSSLTFDAMTPKTRHTLALAGVEVHAA